MMQYETLIHTLFPDSGLPLTFLCGGTAVSLTPTAVTTRRIDANITETDYFAVTAHGLEVRLTKRTYLDFAAAEYTAWLTNRGAADSPVVENLRITGTVVGSAPVLHHGNGDSLDLAEDGYEWWDTSLDAPVSLSPCGDGTSCNGAFPYMRLRFGTDDSTYTVALAVGWSGTWIADFTPAANGVTVSVGQKRCRMVIHPGETIRTPSVTLLAASGDDDAGTNAWRRWYFAHILPRQHGKPLAPKCCMHLFEEGGKPEFTGATEEGQLTAIDAYLAAGIRPDVWWLDAGWYPCDYEWYHIGNWRVNSDNFPNGLTPIGDKCREVGMDFLLWFEPERAWEGSQIDLEHPEWMLRWYKDGELQKNRAVNIGDPACCDYIIDLLDGYIKQFGVTIYRQDFNFNPAPYWAAAEADDRIGAVENQAIQGYYRLWDTLLARNPELVIDSCASGGRRNDIETMRRAVPFHYTDVGYGDHPVKLKQHRQMFAWIPYFRAHNQNWCAPDGTYDKVNRDPDRFSFYVAMAPALTDLTRYDAAPSAFALAREMQPIWRKAAAAMLTGDYYPLTVCRKSSADFYAAEFYDPASRSGILHLLNGATATASTFTVRLKGLEPDINYALTSSETGETKIVSGAALLDGITVTVPPRSGDVMELTANLG